MRPCLPDYGTFPRWPDGGSALAHPDDLEIVNRLLPSQRIFRRGGFDGVYYQFTYGIQSCFRLRPALWLPLRYEGFDIGDQVEVSALGMAREGMIARIVEMRFDRYHQRIEYTLLHVDQVQPRPYLAEELRQRTAKIHLRAGNMGHPAPAWGGKDGDPDVLPFPGA